METNIDLLVNRIEKILRSIPEESITANTLAKIAKMSPTTIEKWLDTISYIQNHYIKIEVMKTRSGSKVFRQVRRMKGKAT